MGMGYISYICSGQGVFKAFLPDHYLTIKR